MAGSGLDLGQTPKGSGLPHFHPGWHQTDKEMPAGEETEGFPGKLGIAMQSVSSSDSTAGQKSLQNCWQTRTWCMSKTGMVLPSLCPSCYIKEARKVCQARMAGSQSLKWGQLKHDLDASVNRTTVVSMGKAGRAAPEWLLRDRREGQDVRTARACHLSCRPSAL